MKINYTTKKIIKGLSLIEILIAISIFTVISLIATRSISLTLKGSKKSDSLVRVRENVNYSLSIIERQIRNSESITCPNPSTLTLNYIAPVSVAASFSCQSIGPNGYIASGSGRLTSSDISVTACSFTCTQIDSNNPPVVKISITASDNESLNVEKGEVTAQTEIIGRNY